MFNISTIELVLLVAAVWRLSNLLANEEGPYMIFYKFRKWAERSRARWVRRSRFATLLKCEYCNSVWFGGFFFTLYLIFPAVAIVLAGPLALSTGAILIKKVVFVLGGIDTYFDKLNNPKLEVHLPKNSISVQWQDDLFEQNAEERR